MDGVRAMTCEYLLVDGYNIIFAWPELKELADVNLDGARTKLQDILCNYQGYKKCQVILVFDGYKVKGNPGEVIRYHNIHVIFTKEAETADHYIERVVTSMPKHYKVRVATGDGLEQLIIYGQGAIRMTARELWNEVTAAETELRERFIRNRPPKNNILADHLDEEALAWFEELRRKNKQQRRIFMAEMTREQKYATTRDEELVLLAQSGDEEAQEIFVG